MFQNNKDIAYDYKYLQKVFNKQYYLNSLIKKNSQFQIY